MKQKSYYNRGAEIDDAILTTSQRDIARMEFRLSKRWLVVVFAIMVLSLGLLGARVVYLGIIKGADYRVIAQKNSLRHVIIPASRGKILDYKGEELVSNVPQTDIVIRYDSIPQDREQRKQFVRKLSEATHIAPQDIFAQIDQDAKSWQSEFVLKQKLTQEEILTFMEHAHNLSGVRLVTTAHRQYVDGMIFAHVLGYTGAVREEDLQRDSSYYITDHIGKMGIEKTYESLLRGTHGEIVMAVDALGRYQRVAGEHTPVAGSDLYLTIDAGLQKKLYDTLERFMKRADSQKACAVALDPRDGSVRALVSLPSYDNNLFAQGIGVSDYQRLINDENQPLFNRVIAGTYAPGSTVKPFLAGAALTEGVIDEHTTVNSTGSIRVGAWTFRDWRVNGVADVRRAIAVSHDIFFYAIGGGYGSIKGMGINTMKRYYQRFGFGELTGIDLPGEVAGFIPDAHWKQEKFGTPWTIGNDYHVAIGQGFVSVTPLQIANATMAIANKGTLWKPHLMAYAHGQSGNITSYRAQRVREHLFDTHIMDVVREGMRMTVTEGTAQMLKGLPVEIAGKTGTAQVGGSHRTNSWFSSFAPYQSPELVLLILVEGQSERTSTATVPVAKEVYQWYFDQRHQESEASE